MTKSKNYHCDEKKNIDQNIFLVGLMGAGKTTVGKLLAKRLDRLFFDSDIEIENYLGVTISQIFELEGEKSFRKWEEKFINDLTCRQGVILATGGGAILSEINRNNLKSRGLVVYLYATVEELYERIHQTQNRPLLSGSKNMKQVLYELYALRDPYYRECAHFIVETNKVPLTKLITHIVSLTTEEKMSDVEIIN